ncbi:integration host factor, partial [Rathayibacter sp. AY1D2]
GRNPQTGETIQIAAGHSVKVSAGTKLKAAAK